MVSDAVAVVIITSKLSFSNFISRIFPQTYLIFRLGEMLLPFQSSCQQGNSTIDFVITYRAHLTTADIKTHFNVIWYKFYELSEITVIMIPFWFISSEISLKSVLQYYNLPYSPSFKY